MSKQGNTKDRNMNNLPNLQYDFNLKYFGEFNLSVPRMYVHFLFCSGLIFSSYLLLRGAYSIFRRIANYLRSKFTSPKYLESENKQNSEHPRYYAVINGCSNKAGQAFTKHLF